MEDIRRCLGCLQTDFFSSAPNSTHPKPVPSKLGSLLKEAVVKKLAEDTSNSTIEISIEHALGFCPIRVSIAAKFWKFCLTKKINFVSKVYNLESKKAEDKQVYCRVLELTTPYMRFIFCFVSLYANISYLCDRILTVFYLNFNRLTDFQHNFDYAVMDFQKLEYSPSF